MTILTFILIVVLVGVALYFVNRIPWMEGNVKMFLNVTVIIILVIWFLSLIGILPAWDVAIPRVR